MTKAISFEYQFVVPRDKSGNPIFEKVKNFNLITLGFGDHIISYLGRKKAYFETHIFDYGIESFPILSLSLGLIKALTDSLEFILTVTAVPTKLVEEHRKNLEDGLEFYVSDDNFKIWWDNDPRGSRKRTLEDKDKIIKEIKLMPQYSGASDLKLEDIEITPTDALEFFGFNKNIKVKELKKLFKPKFRELQLKYHPDTDNGDQAMFMHLQNCREVLEGWMKRG